jgi:hypothetical protein
MICTLSSKHIFAIQQERNEEKGVDLAVDKAVT